MMTNLTDRIASSAPESPLDKVLPPFCELFDLASSRLGGKTLAASDEFFASKENLLSPTLPVFIADKFTENGKWMDGWETRRRRAPGHDWCIIRLGHPGVIRGVDLDTSHFLGNYPEHASVEACWVSGDPDAHTVWTEILPVSELRGGSHNFFAITDAGAWTHLRLNIFPDGGVARFRAYGEVRPDPKVFHSRTPIDLGAVENGGLALLANDMFFSHKNNLLMPGRAANMGDGWETKRKRGPGHDWVIVRLGAPGVLTRIEVDTNHFKGNYPESFSLEGCVAKDAPTSFLTSRSLHWEEILPRTKLQGHTQHVFEREILAKKAFTHVRLNIFPDGGISRLRLHGIPEGAK